jgi:repressor LexA
MNKKNNNLADNVGSQAGSQAGTAGLTLGGCSTNSLAPVQRQTLEYLRNYIAEHGYGPTLKDIAQALGVKSISTAHFHLERLEDKGFIKRGEDGSMELIAASRPEFGPTAVPLVGVIAAGRPIEAIETSSMIDIPPSMIDSRGEVYCLEVSGESMIDAHICDGDIVVIKKQEHAENGQIVVALLEDGTATLKTFRRLKSGKVMLIPANAQLQPITLDKVKVQGRLIGVIRELH